MGYREDGLTRSGQALAYARSRPMPSGATGVAVSADGVIKFGTDGWRGIIGDDFTYAAVRRCAQGTPEPRRSGSDQRVAVVGYDCRFGSEVFAEDVARVLAGNGVRTLLFDRPSPTQVASWTVIERGATGAAVVTASHNPYLF